jgi:oligoendopeptidase F
LYTELIERRHQVAVNAGFANYRDYKFQELGRFDYTKEDCLNFHSAIKKQIVPIVKILQQEKLVKLGKDKFKPWDSEVDPDGKQPLKPFKTGKELLSGTINMFREIDTYFSDCLTTMDEMAYLDLDSKEGKAPGGYNYPLYEIGVPFIFMNAVGAQRDLVTMVHEGGHAVHSFLSRDLELTGFKSLPSEVAELASMSMELLTMNLWNEFYENEDDFKRAKKEQLESILKIMPWIAQIDEFQHWVYENPKHSVAERHAKWMLISKEYGTGLTDWTGYEEVQATAWQRQMHLFEVPFYYIEYAIAQLGALGVWKNSMTNFPKAIEDYKNALRLGYTKSIPEIYATAGIKFDFTEEYLKELADFVKNELEKL